MWKQVLKIPSPQTISYTSGTGDNILALLDISGAGILVLGNALASWRNIFPSSRFLDKLPKLNAIQDTYDLILYHSGSAASRPRLIGDLQILKKLAGEHGEILYFAENSLSFAKLKQLLRHRNLYQLRRLCYTPFYFHKLFTQSSMPVAKEFVGLPKYEAAEEMVVPGSQFLEVPPHAHVLYRLAARMHRYHWNADGRIYLISNRSLEDRAVVKAAAHQIQGYLNNQGCVCTVERFDMRLRGSLVIFITEQNTRRNFITRLVSDPYVQKLVRRNQNFLNILHNSSILPAAIKNKLPEPIGEARVDTNMLFTETLIQGRLAWKIHQGGLRKVIFAEAVEFITTLQLAMRQSMLLTPSHAEEFFSADVQRICKVRECDPELSAGVLTAVKKMRRLISGRTFPLTISHGDYGYGNILVHPATGHLAGVIDWDTGRVNDLPGIDYLNLVVQKIRSECGQGVARAFREASEEVWRKGFLDDKHFYVKEFDLTGKRLKIILYACLVRYMSRAAQYPEVFLREQRDYLESLQHLEDLVPL